MIRTPLPSWQYITRTGRKVHIVDAHGKSACGCKPVQSTNWAEEEQICKNCTRVTMSRNEKDHRNG